MKSKGKGKDASVKSKKKDADRSGGSPGRYELAFEVPLRVRAASREAANLEAMRWLTDALLKAERPAGIRVSPPQERSAASAVPAGTADAVETAALPPSEVPGADGGRPRTAAGRRRPGPSAEANGVP